MCRAIPLCCSRRTCPNVARQFGTARKTSSTVCGEHCRMLPCPCHPCSLIVSHSAWTSVGAFRAYPGQAWERRPLSRGPWSALSSVRDVPWLVLFPVGVDGASRGNCPHHLSFSLRRISPSQSSGVAPHQAYNKHFVWGFTAHHPLLG